MSDFIGTGSPNTKAIAAGAILVKLIEGLVRKGVLSTDDAATLLDEVEAELSADANYVDVSTAVALVHNLRVRLFGAKDV